MPSAISTSNSRACARSRSCNARRGVGFGQSANALGMTTAQYGKRLGVSQPRIVELEKSEQEGGVTLNTLQRAAEALGCRPGLRARAGTATGRRRDRTSELVPRTPVEGSRAHDAARKPSCEGQEGRPHTP